jgi:hypothetical protein
MAKVDFLSDVEVPVTSAEDIVLAKLRWYDLGDILGILRVQRGPRLGVAELVSQLPRYT